MFRIRIRKFWASRIRHSEVRIRILPLSSKNSKKTLIYTVLWLFHDFLSVKTNVNVASKSNKQKNLNVTDGSWTLVYSNYEISIFESRSTLCKYFRHLARRPDLMNGEQLVPGIVIGFADLTSPPPTPIPSDSTHRGENLYGPGLFYSLIWQNLGFTNSKTN